MNQTMNPDLVALIDAKDSKGIYDYAKSASRELKEVHLEVSKICEAKGDFVPAIFYSEDLERKFTLLDNPLAYQQAKGIITEHDKIYYGTPLGLRNTPGLEMIWILELYHANRKPKTGHGFLYD